MIYYTAYGLHIASELPLPELLAASAGRSDVQVRFGKVPTALPNPCTVRGAFQAAPGTLLLTVPDIARYLVVEGQDIWIERVPKSMETDVRVFLLGSALGALLHQRHILAMHASAIQTARGAVLFVGPSGHGKSTLLAAFLQRGYAMLADDVTGVKVDASCSPIALPAFPCMRLWSDAAATFQYPVEQLHRVWAFQDKYLVPVIRFYTEPLPVHTVYALTVHETPDITLEPVENLHRFEVIATNTYRACFLEGLMLRQVHFHAAIALANAVHVRRIARPPWPFLLHELVDRIEADLG